MEGGLQKFHVARESLFHNRIANHVEVRQVTGSPQEDHLQALKDQQHLARRKDVIRTLPGEEEQVGPIH